jgi:hypothetical protein
MILIFLVMVLLLWILMSHWLLLSRFLCGHYSLLLRWLTHNYWLRSFLLWLFSLQLLLDLFFIVPYSRQLPDLDLLILAATDQLLVLLDPMQLSDRSTVGLEDIDRCTFFCRPHCDIAILVSSDNLTVPLPPN